ncbi:MAG: ABC transporter permease [Planctomycetota bacterium]
MTDPTPEATPRNEGEADGGAPRWRRLLDVLGPFLGLAFVVLLFAIVAPSGFVSAYNAKTIATQTVIVGLSAIGMTFVIRSGGIDLSVGSTIALSSVVTALCMRDGLGEFAAVVLGVASGAAVGFVNGGLVTRLALPPFIVTLGTLGAARGVAKWLGDEQKVDAPSGWLEGAMSKSPDPAWLVVAPGVWLMVLAAIAAAVLLRCTVFGAWTTAIGSNESTARLCGVPVERTKVLIYVLAGAAAGLSGVLQFGRLTVGDPTTALGKELDVIAAVVIGGASLSGGTGTILGALIGAFLMATLANGCNLSGVPNYVQEILIGAIIVGAVALDGIRHGRGAGSSAQRP